MASNQAARVTGIVLKQDVRSGSKAQADGSLKNWQMQSARILVGGEDVCDVSYGSLEDLPGRGEAVDLLVSVRASGGFLNIDHVSDWTERHSAASAA
jgi:hypothetical protein